ncbi:MAG: adenylyltransferase/cytidyltransferase family protein [Verrucomicrobiae bacterium]|nr:adenylyltransferase/cytidyltransferase family protein [Verrucomicrobiae bacterium]
MKHNVQVIVSGPFDDLRSRHVRLLEEAARLGPVRVLLWDDASTAQATGNPVKFPLAERHYFLSAIRYVDSVTVIQAASGLPVLERAAPVPPAIWVYPEEEDSPARQQFCARHGWRAMPLAAAALSGFPEPPAGPVHPERKKVIVTGCYDWLHSGHVRFFEEVSALGDLYVAVGNDANVRHLKGAGHPLLCQDERRYMVGSIRYVTQAVLTTGWGWLDAEPEIRRLQPHIYAVNEDGDKPEKRAYCEAHGLEYVVLKRTPAPGLPARSSTALRGF